jgi:hypothetical protein
MSEVQTESLGIAVPKDDIQEKINEISTVTKNIKSGLESFKERKELLEGLAKEANEIKVTSIEQKDLIEKASTIRKKIKKERVKVENDIKELRRPMNQMNDFISAKGKELLAIVAPAEEVLEQVEAWVEEQYAEQARKEEEAAQAKFLERVSRLKEYGQQPEEAQREAIKLMTDAVFETVLEYAKDVFEKDQEAKRLAEEKERKDKEELEKLRKERQKIIDSRTKVRKQELENLGFKFFNGAYEFANPNDEDDDSIVVHMVGITDNDDEQWESGLE